MEKEVEKEVERREEEQEWSGEVGVCIKKKGGEGRLSRPCVKSCLWRDEQV